MTKVALTNLMYLCDNEMQLNRYIGPIGTKIKFPSQISE